MRSFLRVTALLLLILLMLFGVLPVMGAAPLSVTPSSGDPLPAPPQTGASSAVLFDVTGDRFLLLQNADERRPMASTTKIMTALIVLERCDLDEVISVPPEAVGTEGSSIYLFAGERITVKTLLYALLLSSANDAAVALACHTAGSVADFANMMNARAAEMGLTDTHFSNPHGLHDEAHYTTARELALIAREALKNKTFSEIVATRRYSAPQLDTDGTRLFLNHNRLLGSYEGTVGVKTGFTKKSGRCLVSSATRNGLQFLAVTLNDGGDWQDHKMLFDWGFAHYECFSPTPAPITLPVVGGTARTVAVLPASTLSLTLPRTHGEITCKTELPRFLFGGFEAGKTVGRLLYYADGDLVATLPLQTAEAVPRATLRRGFFKKIQDIFIK